MVFQHFALFPHRTVGENAAYGLEIQGIPRDERERKATEALRLVGLKGWEDSLPGQLSGGMRQRVGLARALAAGTNIMLMDEAFSALDPLIKREMQDQLVELQNKLGKTILFITHDLNEAMRLGDRIAMMRDGRIVQIGTAEEILNDPANDYVAQFVQDVDRTRVLTAGAVMVPPVALVGSEQGPWSVHKLMREHQTARLFVVDREKTAVRRGRRGGVVAASSATERRPSTASSTTRWSACPRDAISPSCSGCQRGHPQGPGRRRRRPPGGGRARAGHAAPGPGASARHNCSAEQDPSSVADAQRRPRSTRCESEAHDDPRYRGSPGFRLGTRFRTSSTG